MKGHYFTGYLCTLLFSQCLSASSYENKTSLLPAFVGGIYAGALERLLFQNNEREVTNANVLTFIHATLSQAGIPDAETIKVYERQTESTGYYPGYRSVSISSDLYWDLSSEFCTLTGTFPNGYVHKFPSTINPEVLKKHWLALFEIAPYINRTGFATAKITQLASLVAIEGLWHILAPYIGCEEYMFTNDASYEKPALLFVLLTLGKISSGLAASFALLKTQEYGALGCKPIADY